MCLLFAFDQEQETHQPALAAKIGSNNLFEDNNSSDSLAIVPVGPTDGAHIQVIDALLIQTTDVNNTSFSTKYKRLLRGSSNE